MTSPDTPDPRKVAEAALDMLVYAPVGFALEAKELLPKLAERGRNQVVLARLGARFAVQKAEAEAEKFLARMQADDRDVVAAEPSVSAEPARKPATKSATKAAAKPGAKPSTKRQPASATVGRAAAPAIPGYDTLSASQVVPRLDALRPRELEAIRQHEIAHRGRRTILSRIAQLQSERGSR